MACSWRYAGLVLAVAATRVNASKARSMGQPRRIGFERAFLAFIRRAMLSYISNEGPV